MRKYFCEDNGFVEHHEWEPFCWVNVENPSKEDIAFLIDDLDVPSDFLDAVADIDERPRVEKADGWKFSVLRIPHKTAGAEGASAFSTVPIGIISNNEVKVTICWHHTEQLSDFVTYTRRKGLEIPNMATFVLRIIYSATYWYLQYIKEINHDLTLAEKKLQKSIENHDLLVLQRLQSSLVYFSTSLPGDQMVISRLKNVYGEDLDQDLLEDVEIEINQAINTVSIYSDIINNMTDSYASIISNNVNNIMKRMTAISIILMFPTLVASWFGMNVDLPFSSHPNAFWWIMAGSLGISIILYIFLSKIHWL